MTLNKQKNGLYTPQLESDSCGVGMLCNINGLYSHYVITNGLTMLENMEHRGAYGAEKNSGDGAGILTAIPHKLFKGQALKSGIKLPEIGSYGVGMFFMPKDPLKKEFCRSIIRKQLEKIDKSVLMIRPVPVDNSMVGSTALSAEPDMEQWFIDYSGFEKELNSTFLVPAGIVATKPSFKNSVATTGDCEFNKISEIGFLTRELCSLFRSTSNSASLILLLFAETIFAEAAAIS